MNYMKQVAEMLGVELNERFKLEDCYDHKITEGGLYFVNNIGIWEQSGLLQEILKGKYTIIKKPWKPKKNEWYFFCESNGNINRTNWVDDVVDFYFFNAGNCFKTKEEITPEIKERILKEMREQYEKD